MKQFELIDYPNFANGELRSTYCAPMEGFDELLAMARSRTIVVANMCSMPLLTKEQEQYLFRQFNALKYSANVAVDNGMSATYNRLVNSIKEVKEVIFMCNVRLIASFLKKKQLPADQFEDKFSNCCEYLGRVINKFNFAFGYKFSTYCTWAFIKNYMHYGQLEQRDANRLHFIEPEVFVENFDLIDDSGDESISIDYTDLLEYMFRKAKLTQREVQVMVEYNGLLGVQRTMTDIGKEWGRCKDNIRQIKDNGVKKLQKLLRKNKNLMALLERKAA